MNVIKCDLTHVKQITRLVEEFCLESSWGLTFDKSKAALDIYDFVQSEERAVFGVSHENKLIGFAGLMVSNSGCIEYQGFIYRFFITKQKRKTRAAIKLMQACLEWFEKWDCDVFCSSTSGLDSGVICTFEKLMQKYAFEALRPVFVKRKLCRQ